MLNFTTQQKVYFVLRLAVAMCFIGHGAFGIITKPVWCNYFAVFGIGKTMAYQLMPWVGAADVAFGIIMLVYPMRIVPLWLVCWGLVTASLRPLSGEPFAEFLERAGNFGAPLALLLLCGGGKSIKGWFSLINPIGPWAQNNSRQVQWCLKAVVFLLLLGHGWLNLIAKPGLISQYQAIGFNNSVQTAYWVGIAEIAAAGMVWFDELNTLLFIFFIWKMLSELFYPHYELFEFIERGGSYGSILALWLVRYNQNFKPKLFIRRTAIA
ncbi:hypothetical protein GCM10027037_09410 [Mucilaginibacter koreensis]